MKAYGPNNEVGYDDVRALIGVMQGERDVSKGIIATTSHFPAGIETEPTIAPFIQTRLELMDPEKLRDWLTELSSREKGDDTRS